MIERVDEQSRKSGSERRQIASQSIDLMDEFPLTPADRANTLSLGFATPSRPRTSQCSAPATAGERLVRENGGFSETM